MMHSSHGKPPTLAPWLALVFSALVASYFLATDAADYLISFTATVYGRHWPARNWMFTHIAAGGVALALGTLQLCLALLGRTSRWHRWAGRAYVGAVIIACAAAMTVLRNGTVLGPVFAALLVLLSACALLFTGMGVRAARRRQRQAHSRWMIRSYMAMMVFAWFRLGMELPVLQDVSLQARVATVLALTMLITFGATELALRRQALRMSKPERSAISVADGERDMAERYPARRTESLAESERLEVPSTDVC